MAASAPKCPSPGCPHNLTREDDLPYLGCEMHGPMVPVCIECGEHDGRTACGALLCHDCKENE